MTGPTSRYEVTRAIGAPREVVWPLPVRHYRADVVLEEAGHPDAPATALTWSATFEPAVPGTGALMERLLYRMIGRFAARLAARAEAAGSIEASAGASGGTSAGTSSGTSGGEQVGPPGHEPQADQC